MIVLDTTVLVYAVGAEHPLREPCRELVTAIGDGAVSATTTVEVVQELAHVRARRRERRDAIKVATDFARLLGPLLLVTEQHLHAGLDLWARHPRLGCFDAVLAAATISAGGTLVSADKAFGRIRGLAHSVPDTKGVKRLLG
jgi:predicted nucleic acid-binding protein